MVVNRFFAHRSDHLILMERRRVADLWRHARANADESATTWASCISSCLPIWDAW
jgi:hypothetical protein